MNSFAPFLIQTSIKSVVCISSSLRVYDVTDGRQTPLAVMLPLVKDFEEELRPVP